MIREITQNEAIESFYELIGEIECGNNFDKSNQEHITWLNRKTARRFGGGAQFYGYFGEDSIPIGIGAVLIDDHPFFPEYKEMTGYSELVVLGVFPEYRNQGYGSKNYRYNNTIKVNKLKDKLQLLANGKGLSENSANALFLAAMIAEPSRNTVAYITQILAINNPENQDKNAFASKGRALSMPAGGTDQEPKEGEYDSNLYQENKEWKKHNSEVTTIDLNSVKNYPGLMDEIVVRYDDIMKSKGEKSNKVKKAKLMMKKLIINKLNTIPDYE